MSFNISLLQHLGRATKSSRCSNWKVGCVFLKHRKCLSFGALKLFPVWDPLPGDPRFEQIVSSLAPK
jgi:hypothetical protein